MASKSDDGWEVLITTYNLAQGDEKDRKFFRRVAWDVGDMLVLLYNSDHLCRHASSTKVTS